MNIQYTYDYVLGEHLNLKEKKNQKKINVEMVFDHPSKKIKTLRLDTLHENIQYAYIRYVLGNISTIFFQII